MSAKPDKTLVTAQDVIEYLWSLLYKKRSCRIENDFQFGYDRALNEVMYRLMFASSKPECCTCAGGALEDQTMTVLDVLDDLFDAIQGMKNRLSENDFEKGFDSAIYVLMYQVWSASPEWAKSQFALPEIPERCNEGAKVIYLADARPRPGSHASSRDA